MWSHASYDEAWIIYILFLFFYLYVFLIYVQCLQP